MRSNLIVVALAAAAHAAPTGIVARDAAVITLPIRIIGSNKYIASVHMHTYGVAPSEPSPTPLAPSEPSPIPLAPPTSPDSSTAPPTSSDSSTAPFRFVAFVEAVREARALPPSNLPPKESLVLTQVPPEIKNMTYDDVSKDDDDAEKAIGLGLGLGLGLGIPITSGGALAAAYALKMAAVLGKSPAAEVAELGVQALTEAGSLLEVAASHGVPASLTADAAQTWLQTLPESAQALLQGEMAAVTQVFEQGAAGMASQFAAGEQAAITSLQAADGLLNVAEGTLPAGIETAMGAIRSVDAGIAKVWPETVQMMQQMARMAEIRGVQVPAETVAALDEIMTVTARSMARYIGRAELSRAVEGLDKMHNVEFDAPLEWARQVDQMRPQLYKQIPAMYEAVHGILNSKAVDLTPLRINAYRMATGSLPVARDIVANTAAGAGSSVGSLFSALGKLFDPGHTVATNAGKWSDNVINSQRPATFQSPTATKPVNPRPHSEYYPDFAYDLDVQLRNVMNRWGDQPWYHSRLYKNPLKTWEEQFPQLDGPGDAGNQATQLPPTDGVPDPTANPTPNLETAPSIPTTAPMAGPTTATSAPAAEPTSSVAVVPAVTTAPEPPSSAAVVTVTTTAPEPTTEPDPEPAPAPAPQLATALTDRGSTYCNHSGTKADHNTIINAVVRFCAEYHGRAVSDGAKVESYFARHPHSWNAAGGPVEVGSSVRVARGFTWTIDRGVCERNMRHIVDSCDGGSRWEQGGQMVTMGVEFSINPAVGTKHDDGQ